MADESLKTAGAAIVSVHFGLDVLGNGIGLGGTFVDKIPCLGWDVHWHQTSPSAPPSRLLLKGPLTASLDFATEGLMTAAGSSHDSDKRKP
jgi:hypothetical protein